MNRKGFTVIELLAVIIVLGLVTGITLTVSSGVFSSAKEKSEEVFVSSLKDAIEIYLDNEGKKVAYDKETCDINKSYGKVVAKKEIITFSDVINSSMSPLVEAEYFNPSNNENCNLNAKIYLYRDEDYVYYYKFDKSTLSCLTEVGMVSTLPSGASGC